jgi:ATP-dependent RNA helicase MSS116
VDAVREECEQTHEHVKQHLHVVSPQNTIAALVSIINQHIRIPDYKILVFFTTARVAGFMADLFTVMSLNVMLIHSRMSQSARTKTSEKFRVGSKVIMFSSDVSARGMDYPDVTFVLQVGCTEKSQYIHRLGRTARAGKEGFGMLLLCDFEEVCMGRELAGLPIDKLPLSVLNIQNFDGPCSQALSRVECDDQLKKSGEQAYQAWLGYYNGKLRILGWSKEQLVVMANAFAASIGLAEVPELQKKTIGKMGLKGVKGLRIAPFVDNI